MSIAASAFGVLEITPDFQDDVIQHLLGHTTVFAVDSQTGEPIGFGIIAISRWFLVKKVRRFEIKIPTNEINFSLSC
ncbi:hypothetical protein HGB07_02310 [Candidatus Roizmanbacteria bacterium]|nr:hypothetical protein [Candidatus Roizmanbacteria bacterium]